MIDRRPCSTCGPLIRRAGFPTFMKQICRVQQRAGMRGFPGLIAVLVFALLAASQALAHEVRPAYLQVAETGPGVFSVLWKQPVLQDRRLPIDPIFPESCAPASPVVREVTGSALLQSWTIECPLREGAIHISGLSRTITDVMVEISRLDGEKSTHLLRPDAPSLNLSDPSPQVAAYLTLGVEHLVFGIDHVLFVIGLVLFIPNRWALLKTITAFTLAHSITLALSVLELVRLPQGPVEAVIALSILFLARELTMPEERRSALTRGRPWIMALLFGLLHGFGFAGRAGRHRPAPGSVGAFPLPVQRRYRAGPDRHHRRAARAVVDCPPHCGKHRARGTGLRLCHGLPGRFLDHRQGAAHLLTGFGRCRRTPADKSESSGKRGTTGRHCHGESKPGRSSRIHAHSAGKRDIESVWLRALLHWDRPLIPRVSILAAVVLLAGCGARTEPAAVEQSIRPAKVIVVQAPGRVTTHEFVARVEAAQSIDLSFEVDGVLAELSVREGQTIERGELVAALDPTDFRLAVREAELQVQLARQDLDRKHRLLDQHGIAASLVDDARSMHQLQQVRLEQRRESLAKSRIVAPFDAQVARRYLDNHVQISAGDPIVRLNDLHELQVVAGVPEQLLVTRQHRTGGRHRSRLSLRPGTTISPDLPRKSG